MIFQIVAIHDRALDAYQQPFLVRAIGEAIRAFQDAINKPESPMYAHPDDYDLYMIGTYNDESAKITQAAEPQQIAIGKQLRIQQ
jgi:hypothetical protein